MEKWSKEADRSLSERANQVRWFWASYTKGTYNVGRNQAKRERRASEKARRTYAASR